jgi:outer membrane protein TolC
MPANFRRKCILLLAFLHAPFPLASFGQQTAASSSGTVQLTLKQAVQLALRQNPQRVIARLLVFESDRNSQIARSPLLPHADIEASGSLNQYNFQSIERAPPLRTPVPFRSSRRGLRSRKASSICL